ncbi:MAG: GPW/gp25 family protein [Saprospirales bacterium]|nr:GPW/gp25 family protein [Saprospirales bacterium]
METERFYSMPFRTELLGKKGSLEKCSLADSIRQNIRVLLLSPPGRYRYDPFLGCKIHRFQFMANNRAMEGRKEEDLFRLDLQENIKQLIQRYEPRILLSDVEVELRQDPSEQIPWKSKRATWSNKSVIQVIVSIKGKVKPEYALDQELELEDTISLI